MASYQGDWDSRQSDEQGYAYNAFKRFFGREPSEVELAQATSAYQSGDKNKPNVQTGDAFVAQMYQEKHPNEDNIKKAPEKYGDIENLFNQYVGRSATQEEKDHFGAMLASGQVDQYQLGEALKNLPETVRKEDETFRQTLGKELQAGDQRYFSEEIMPSIQSQFAKQGRTVESTGFQNALAREATGQNRERERFLADLTARQYEGNKGRAYEEYVGGRNYAQGRSDFIADRNYQQLYDIQNYATQKNAYDDYLKRYGKRGGGFAGAASGAMSGAMAGGMAGGPWGAVAGGIGGGLLGGFSQR